MCYVVRLWCSKYVNKAILFTKMRQLLQYFIWDRRLAIRSFSKWNSNSLSAWLKCRSDSFFIIHEFRNKDHFKHIFLELILIPEITNWEIRINSTLRYFCQAGWLTGCQDFISKNLLCGTPMLDQWILKLCRLNYLLIQKQVLYSAFTRSENKENCVEHNTIVHNICKVNMFVSNPSIFYLNITITQTRIFTHFRLYMHVYKHNFRQKFYDCFHPSYYANKGYSLTKQEIKLTQLIK